MHESICKLLVPRFVLLKYSNLNQVEMMLSIFAIIIIMIKRIVSITQFALLINRATTPFCEKADILKTYLEIIPPHKIYEIR